MSENQTSLEASGAGFTAAAGNVAMSSEEDSGEARRAGRRRSDRIILASGSTQRAVDQAADVARSDAPLLIVGPSGSGRQHFSRAVHEWSRRAGQPLSVFSAGATPEVLQARELFGGTPSNEALPGTDDAGAIASAGQGSLLIDRADLLCQPVRERLAQALKDGHFSAEGRSDQIPLRVRIIATTSVGAEDVLGDAGIKIITLDSLSARKEDILPLAAHFLAEFAEEEGLSAVGFTVDARRWLVEEPWEGNVRELRERIRQAVGLAGSGSISAESLMLSTEGEEVPSFKEAKRAFETRYVEGLLRRCAGNISRAARLAKKDRKDFYDVIRRTGVDPAQFRG
jgi:two-component system response regulator GlrR